MPQAGFKFTVILHYLPKYGKAVPPSPTRGLCDQSSKLVLRRPYSRMPMEMGRLCWERQDRRAEEKSGCQGRKRAGQEQTRMVSEGVWLWDCPLLSLWSDDALGGTTRAAPSCGVLLPRPSTLLQHPDPLLPLGQTQSSGLHGLQIRCATPQPLLALWRVSASSTLRRATPHPWTVAGQILLCATTCQQRADFLQGLRPRTPG